ncbi:MAG: hypothetical protein KatS3mg104_1637 [Phycisphaerae bacterium]|nr:MAG: hypothetical protein KatS3mg104_1637 [Phycisphaerae bacterium]
MNIPLNQIPDVVKEVVSQQSIIDIHTHLYSPAFGTPVEARDSKVDPTGLLLWGIDELVTYHYLVAEVFRVVPASKLPYEQFWKLTKQQQADHIWKHLFVENAPLSEACRGVLTTLQKLGLDPNEKNARTLPTVVSCTESQSIHRPGHENQWCGTDHHDQPCV